ncbi:hypothetical protein Taro_016947 [Colocasia esculenta]|uniref:Uncharacterized protein n=1 Tax=Colocasia esculenta TaxID=4460 RepID=A0A843UUI8_COLES|nr:hypothetical protein [Colocasia esculenta]
MPINFQDWRKVPKTCKDDVFAYVQRKCDISDGRKKWVFQDLNNKWRSWKYVNRKLYFKYNGKAKQQIRLNAPHLDLDQWKEAVQQWTSLEWKEKLKSLKSAQPPSDDCTPHHVAARNDTYTQVLGPDRPGHVSGVGTGPTPTSMWGNESKDALRTENRLLMQRMEELETTNTEKFAKMESMIRGSQILDPAKSGHLVLPAVRTDWSMPSPTPMIEPSVSHSGTDSALRVSTSSTQWNSSMQMQGTGNNEFRHHGVGIS